MDCAFHTEDPRQRVADYAAVLVLTRAAAEHVDLSIARLGSIVAAFLPSLEPARLRAWSDMDMAKAVRTIKIDLLRHQIDLAEAGTGRQAVGPAEGWRADAASRGRRRCKRVAPDTRPASRSSPSRRSTAWTKTSASRWSPASSSS